MTTLKEALATLEYVKAEFSKKRAAWREREVYLLEELRKAKADTRKVEREVEAKEEGPTPKEIRDAALTLASGTVDNVRMHAEQAASRWASLDAGERKAASREERMWAHPFVHAAVGVVAIKLDELKE